MDCGYVHNFVNTLLYSPKELAICSQDWQSHLNNIQINFKFIISVLWHHSFGELKEES